MVEGVHVLSTRQVEDGKAGKARHRWQQPIIM